MSLAPPLPPPLTAKQVWATNELPPGGQAPSGATIAPLPMPLHPFQPSRAEPRFPPLAFHPCPCPSTPPLLSLQQNRAGPQLSSHLGARHPLPLPLCLCLCPSTHAITPPPPHFHPYSQAGLGHNGASTWRASPPWCVHGASAGCHSQGGPSPRGRRQCPLLHAGVYD